MKTMREKEVEETRRLLDLWGVGQVDSIRIVKRVVWHLDDADRLQAERDALATQLRAMTEERGALYEGLPGCLHCDRKATRYQWEVTYCDEHGSESGGTFRYAPVVRAIEARAALAATTEDKST